jgi:hypothetical protein
VVGEGHAPAVLPPGKRPGTHCIGGWVGSRAGLDGCGISRPQRDSILGSSSLWRVALPTELSRPMQECMYSVYLHCHSPPNARFRELLFLLYSASCSLLCAFSYYVPYYVLLFFCIFRVIPFFASNFLIILCFNHFYHC